jgi:hypothetical protein
MEKTEAPKTTGTKDADQGGQEGSGSFGTEDIWKNALKKFQAENQIAEKEINDLVTAGDIASADNGAKKATELFKTWRHPPGKETKVMEAVSGCLDWVDAAAGFIQDHVSGTVSTPVLTCTSPLLMCTYLCSTLHPQK